MVAIGFNDTNSKKLAEEKIKQNGECCSAFSTGIPKKILPKVTVNGIHKILFESCENNDRDEMKDTLFKDIVERNPTIKKFLTLIHLNFFRLSCFNDLCPLLAWYHIPLL